MPGTATRKKLHREDDDRTLQSMKWELKPHKKGQSKSRVAKCLHEGNVNASLKKKIVKKAIVQKAKSSKKQSSLKGVKDKQIATKESEKTDDIDVKPQKLKRKRRRKKRKNNVELDEASRLQRRTRYLLIKMKLEQNLIDAYSTEGWKGQSREKLKPETELQRAKKQILKCKLGIREAIHQLDLLSSEGRINDSAVAPDGSVHHEHIICSKCKLREAFPDNDIILCDGTCNCAFHQKCLDPPLLTENIPPGDEGWFCKFCKKKMEILEATNAHLGTHFEMDSNWQDVFKEEAALPEGGNPTCTGEDWPSDDSEDDDYDPDRIDRSCSASISGSESDASGYSSSSLGSLEDEPLVCGGVEGRSNHESSLDLIGVDSDEINNCEILSRPRQRATVDYIKLYDEMFGKHATENELISDDEDWGPTKRRRKVKETDAASTLMTLSGTDKNNLEEMPSQVREKESTNKIKRPIFRLPHNAVEKLRVAFAENELPTRALRVSLSMQLGLEFDKVNKWFKNARYLALKARKTGRAQVSEDDSPSSQKETISETAKESHPDQITSKNDIASSCKSTKKSEQRRNSLLLANSFKMKQRRKPLSLKADNNQRTLDFVDDISLKHIREKAKEAKKKLNSKRKRSVSEAEKEMERLCQIKCRVEKLQQILCQFPSRRSRKHCTVKASDQSVVYVPVAELKEKT